MRNAWFESVAEAQRRAKRRLPRSVYGALVAGSEQGLTVGDNIGAFSELGFAPTVAGKPAGRELATTVMGQPVSLPVIISPTGVQAVHPGRRGGRGPGGREPGDGDGPELVREQAR
jgi:isopentenyl diphosphate isomerase/L-lactate dehydrogenase-like FMN-dependent dehydrogenase